MVADLSGTDRTVVKLGMNRGFCEKMGGGWSGKAGGPRSRSRRDRVGHCLPRTDTFDDLLPGLGPPRPDQHTPRLAARRVQTVDCDDRSRSRSPTGDLSGFPTGRPWVSLASRTPPPRTCTSATTAFRLSRTLLPRIRRRSHRFTPALTRLGCGDRLDGALSARGAGFATCGDVNPDRRTARLSAAFRFGWPYPRIQPHLRAACFHRARLAAPSLAADSDRTRDAFLASHGLNRTRFSGAFSYFAGHFHARRRAGIYALRFQSRTKSGSASFAYPPPIISPRLTIIWAVENAVQNLA